MSASNILKTPISSRLLISSIIVATLGTSAMAQAAEAESPYIQLYKNSINTNISSANIINPEPQVATVTNNTSVQANNTNTSNAIVQPNNTNIANTIVETNNTETSVATTSVLYPVRHQETEEVKNINLLNTPLAQIPTPELSVTNISYIPTKLIPQTTSGDSDLLDVSLIDDFIVEVSRSARHYPPKFKNITQQYNAKLQLEEYEQWLRPYADVPSASYEVLLLATKLNIIGKNLDLGPNFTKRANTYAIEALKLQPNNAEINFLYGMMLSEAGGFKIGRKYLEKASGLGYTEAEQSLAQSDLLTDQRPQALSRLRQLSAQDPNNLQLQQQIQAVENGSYNIWNLQAN